MFFCNAFITKLLPRRNALLGCYTRKKILIYICLTLLGFSTVVSGCLQLNKQAIVTANSKGAVTPSHASFPKTVVGMNLNGIADWSTELPFLDAFKSSRPWITQCVKTDPNCSEQWDTKEYNLLNLDKDGWVKSLPAPGDAPKYTRVSTLLLREIPGYYPSGQYIVLYEGEGTISYGFDAKKDEAASTPGRDVINVDSKKGGGILITITSTDPKKNW